MDWRKQTDSCNVVYLEPGLSDRSAMPLGNGLLGISLWVEQNGDLQFYLSHAEAQSEMDRNLKLGKVRLRLSPNPFTDMTSFRQELHLREGTIRVSAKGKHGEVSILVFVDAGQDAVHAEVRSRSPITVEVVYGSWRTGERAPWGLTDLEDPARNDIRETADQVMEHKNGILLHHCNGHTCVRSTAILEGLSDWIDRVPNTLEHRVFGGYATLDGETVQASIASPQCGILSAVAAFTHHLAISAFCGQVEDVNPWFEEIVTVHRQQRKGSDGLREALERTARHWDRIFSTSWMFVSGDPAGTAPVPEDIARVCLEPQEVNPTPSQVTRSYILTRFMFACAAKSRFPVQFNGLLFNLMPGLDRHLAFEGYCETFSAQPATEPTLEINPDEKGWESCINLWQNVRLLYAPLMAQGDFDAVRRLFAHYLSFRDINRIRAKVYYEAEGQYNTEMTNTFGLMPSGPYGSDRTGLKDGYAVNRWGGAVDISPGLELVSMMLDWHEYTEDDLFLGTEILPYAEELLHFIETRFLERREGKLLIAPLQSVETYFDTTNPITVVTGLIAVTNRILALPEGKVANQVFFQRFRTLVPELPLETDDLGNPVLAPAESYKNQRMNVESPEFYAVYPFRLFTHEKSGFKRMEDTWRSVNARTGCFQPHRFENPPGKPCYAGWQYHGMVAALLGHADEAAEVLVGNCRMKNPGTRFPAMWGPVYDAVPDGDHGGNLMNTLQLMALQSEGERIHLLPAWPESWDVEFKLHAGHGTIVECGFREGVIQRLVVTPEERLRDVVFHREDGRVQSPQ